MAGSVSSRAGVFISNTEELLSRLGKQGDNAFFLADGAGILWEREEAITLCVNGRAHAELELCGGSQATIICSERTSSRVTTRGLSSPKIKVMGYADVKIDALGASRPLISSTDYAKTLVHARENSRPHLEAIDMSITMMIVQDQAKASGAGWPEDWGARVSDIYIGQRLVCFGTEEEAISAVRSLYREWVQCRNRYIACLRTPGAIPKLCPNVVDFRWREGTVHMELPGEGNHRPWYSPNAHHVDVLTEARRDMCTRYYLDE